MSGRIATRAPSSVGSQDSAKGCRQAPSIQKTVGSPVAVNSRMVADDRPGHPGVNTTSRSNDPRAGISNDFAPMPVHEHDVRTSVTRMIRSLGLVILIDPGRVAPGNAMPRSVTRSTTSVGLGSPEAAESPHAARAPTAIRIAPTAGKPGNRETGKPEFLSTHCTAPTITPKLAHVKPFLPP